MTLRPLLPTDEEREQMRRLNDRLKGRLKGRQPPAGWQKEIGAPHYPEDRADGECAPGKEQP